MGIQTRENSEEVASQTEPIFNVGRWVQWPPEDLRGFGYDEDKLDEEEIGSNNTIKSQEFLKFLTASSQV